LKLEEISKKLRFFYLFVLAIFLLLQSRNWETEDATQQIPSKVCGSAKDKVTKLWQSFIYSVPQQCQREQKWRWHGWDMWHASS